MRRGFPRGAFDLFLSGMRITKSNVGCNGIGEKKTLLVHNSHSTPVPIQVQLAQIMPVDPNAPLLWVIKARNQTQQGSLARPGHAENPNHLPGTRDKRNIMQDR